MTLLTVALLLAAAANAHHSFAAEFLADETATFHGVVTEVWFKLQTPTIHSQLSFSLTKPQLFTVSLPKSGSRIRMSVITLK